MVAPAMRIAMWSGPRNISTAMMRSFSNRPGTFVSDEPLYAYYLAHTGKPHPGAQAVIDAYQTDWRAVTEQLIGPVPHGHPVWYQKHMSHHLLPDVAREWILQCANAFLIRSPAHMLASLARVLPEVRLEDTGLEQQFELFSWLRECTGKTPPVIDSADVLRDPRAVLSQLCEQLGLGFDEAMLSWPSGPRATDGNWAAHWYDSVHNSSGFTPYQPREVAIAPALERVLAQCEPLYQSLAAYRLRP